MSSRDYRCRQPIIPFTFEHQAGMGRNECIRHHAHLPAAFKWNEIRQMQTFLLQFIFGRNCEKSNAVHAQENTAWKMVALYSQATLYDDIIKFSVGRLKAEPARFSIVYKGARISYPECMGWIMLTCAHGSQYTHTHMEISINEFDWRKR